MLIRSLIFLTLFLKSSLTFPDSLDIDVLKYLVPCELDWIEHNSQYPELPPSAITYFNGKSPKDDGNQTTENKYIAKTKVFGQWILGSYQFGATDAEFYSSKASKESRKLKQKKFHLLTNPNNCYIDWVFVTKSTSSQLQQNSEFKLSDGAVSFSQNGFIGKTNQEKNWELCSLPTEKHKCMTSNIAVDRDSFQMLQSITPRLSFQINNISLNEVMGALAVSFKGTDKILNKAPVDVSSTVTYGVTKSKQISTEKSKTITTGTSNEYVVATTASTSGSSTDEETSEDLDVSHDINVPPMTLVESCSTQVAPELVISYVIDVTFYATGVDAETLQRILSLEKFNGPFVSNDGISIKTQIQGELKGISGMASTKLQINPSDVMSFRSCSTTMKRLNAERKQYSQDVLNGEAVNNVQDLEELRETVRNVAKSVASKLE